MADLVIIFVAIFLFAILLKYISVYIRQHRDYWGLNVMRVRCPHCNEEMPLLRKPKNARQALWGGWTCTNCQAELNKLGIDIADTTQRRERIPLPDFSNSEGNSPIERVFNEK